MYNHANKQNKMYNPEIDSDSKSHILHPKIQF